MKISAALSMLALGLAHAKTHEAENLEKSFERALGADERALWGGGGWGGCCEWVCEEPEPEPEPEPCVYRSKAMMGGSWYGGDDCEPYYRSKAMMRRVKETKKQDERALFGKGWGGPGPWGPGIDGCEWDCSGCGVVGPPIVGPPIVGPPTWPGPGHQCFPTSSTNEDCACTCCGFIPPVVIEPEPEPEPEPCVYRSKAMMGGSWYGGDDCEPYYRSKAMMRRVKETKKQDERALFGKGWGGPGPWGPGIGGPGISCVCECDPPAPEPEPCYYRSKAMMMGGSWYGGDDCGPVGPGPRSKAMMGGGSGYYY